MDRLCVLHEEFGLRYFNVAYMTYFLMPIIFYTISTICRQYGGHRRTNFGRFCKLLRTIFDQDDDPKGISSDEKSNLDS